ncbi:hypothetical protein [Vibrio profundi]|uniref:hypothetical protein n=1 Tax=Vibrio profundi TaxID=1774960 RepID=UPI003734E428
MKLKLLSTLIAASFLAGCSSSGSNGGTSPAPQDGIADVQYIQGEEFDAAYITGDAGDYNALIIRDQTTQNGELTSYVFIDGKIYFVEDGLVTDTNGNEIGNIENQGDQVVFNGVIQGEKVEVVITVVDGRLITDSTIIDTPPKWGDEGATSISIVEEGENKLIYVGEEHVGTINELGTIIKDGKAIGEFEGDRHNGNAYFYDGSTVTFRTDKLNNQTTVTVHKDGMIYTWNSATGERTVSVDESIDSGWGNIDPGFEKPEISDLIDSITREEIEGGIAITVAGHAGGEVKIETDKDGKVTSISANDIAKEKAKNYLGIIDPGFGKPNFIGNLPSSELKEKVRNLSQEQRQQIKQAIKDRASRG